MSSDRSESKIEHLKEDSDYLYAPLAAEIGNDRSHFSGEAEQVLKFHGTYQQDDRDLREGRNRHYIFMIRGRIPGGKLTPGQYLSLDTLSDEYADGTIRVTTRQSFQLHGIVKTDLKQTIREINRALVTTLGACGDVVRNVMATPAPDMDGRQAQVQAYANRLSDILLPATHAYHDLWIDGEKVYSGREEAGAGSTEPLYGRKYLPRKFKVGIAMPGDNSIDVYTQDIGLVALFDGKNEITGFNIIVGGGMGMHHRKPETFPRLGDHLGYVEEPKLVDAVRGIIEIQRDFGNRENRKRARMKYLVHDWGLEAFKEELEKRTGFPLEPFRELPPFEPELYLGWNRQSDGNWFLGVSIENGRIKDEGPLQLKTGLREAVKRFEPGIRLTPNHNLLLTDIEPGEREPLEAFLLGHGILPEGEIANVIKYSMACPALPTCGLAITESERALPDVIRELEEVLKELGLEDDTLSVRMTGCPNGCSRPYVADIGLVGRSLDKYTIFIGGDPAGTRLNEQFMDLVPREELVQSLRPLLAYYAEYRRPEDSFGDFWHREGIEKALAVAEQKGERSSHD